MIILDDAPGDRIITELYVWIVVDLRTQLEGMFSMTMALGEMQCATSSPDMAQKIGELIRKLPIKDKRFKLVKFKPVEVVEEIKK